MAAPDGEVALRDPDALVKEIERTRQNLARTIDELADRLSPASAARRGLARAGEQLARPQVQAVAGAVALITVAAIAFRIVRRRN
jgi:hypothetical protein